MITECVQLKVKNTGNFEDAFAEGVKHIMASPGYLGHTLHHCIEEPDRFMILIQWETLEAHTVTFRESELFQKWRACVGEHFAEAPDVKHYAQS